MGREREIIEYPMLGGRCLDLTVGQFTKADLIAKGLTDAAADELMAFAERLAAKHSRKVSGGTDG